MASGHVNRTYRPNTWLHRPSLLREKVLANPEPSTHDPTRTSRVDARSCATGPGRCHLRQSGPCDYRSQVRNKVLGSSLSQRRG
jgi:hypothetical protein